ncbi:putative phage tail protein [Variovorax ginsengisoli]|uniref:Phage tail protein n=1 Tax=Variovorax ginsengisoli TaxID=363844 RepID=A0ABT9S6M0_9BURK|nr:putative phage tail protein [Variovorax ginsengisoli]
MNAALGVRFLAGASFAAGAAAFAGAAFFAGAAAFFAGAAAFFAGAFFAVAMVGFPFLVGHSPMKSDVSTGCQHAK